MTDSELSIAETFVSLAGALATGRDVLDTMDDLIQASTAHTSAVEAGIVLADSSGILHVVASTSERATQLEEEQLGTDEGPCWDAFQGGEAVEIADIAETSARWPRFAAAAERRGFRAAHAVPLRLRERTFGSLNLFSVQPGSLSDADAALAQAFADVATISILQQESFQRGADVAAELQSALDGRVLIEQAKGMIAQRHGTSVEDAFQRLRDAARRSGKPVREIARLTTVNQADA